MTGKGRTIFYIFDQIGRGLIKNLKWLIIPALLILGFLLILAIVTRSNGTNAEPDKFSQSYSLLVQENWDSNFISSIKLVINSDDVYINGKLTKFETKDLFPIINNNRVFLPLGLIPNLIKATVKYDGDRKAIIERSETSVEITIGRNNITVNSKDDSKNETLEAASFIYDGKIMAPLGIMRFLGFDAPVWDAGSTEIILTKTFQTRRLLVVTNGGKLTETYGALQVLEGPDNLYVLQYASEEAAIKANEFYNNDPDILFSQPDAVLNSEVSSDSLSWGVGRIGVDYYTEQLVQYKLIKNEVIVAVLDTGIDFNHPFLKNRISNIKWNFVTNTNNPNDVDGHGTHVSGIIVDSTPSNVKIMPLKVLGEGGGSTGNICNAIRYAADSGADVINMSLGGPLGSVKRDMFFEQAINYALSLNVIVVVAAGNENEDVMNFCPAYYSKLITVAATDANDKKADFSNFGNAIDIAAPGVSIRSSFPGGDFVELQGTSMAAPFVAASAALLRITNNSLSQEDVITMLSDNADNVGPAEYFGAGIINVVKLAPQNGNDGIQVTGISINPSYVSLLIGANERFFASVRPGNAINPGIAWKSNNPQIAKVSRDGMVTGVNPGNTVLTASTIDGNVRATAIVSVLANEEAVDPWKKLLAITPFVIILLLSFRVNLSKPKRSRQFILPFIAVIYCIIAMLYADKANKWITSSIAWLSYFSPFFAININKWLIYIFNTVIAGSFLIIKSILLPIISMVWSKPGSLFNQTSGKFYEHNERMNAWVLKDEFGQAKTLWKGFYWFAVGISSLLLALSQVFSQWIFFRTPFYPVCGMLVLGEILFFLSGLTFQEMVSTIAGEDDEFYRIANYGILRRIFHELFDNRILYDNTADSLFGLTSFEMLDKLAESENTLDNVISKYFTELKERGHIIDPGFVRSSIEMVQGKSVLLNTPFYRDMTGYIVLPIVRRLMAFEKALIIVGRDSSAEDVKNWMHNGIATICGTPELWKTDILTEKKTECDVAVLRFADVYNHKKLKVNKEFLNRVGFVLLIEPSRIVSTGQIGLSLIVDQLGKGEKDTVYCSCDRNCDGLVDALSHILKVNLTEVYATVPTLANCSLMYWKAQGNFMHHKIYSNIAHYLGIGTELSSVALRNQIAKTVWVSSERFPVIDMRWIAGQYYNVICNYTGQSQNQEAFAEVFKVDANLWNLGVEDNAFLTVEDEFNNLFEMTRLYSTRAKNQGFVNVISENYLLRDYMVDNAPVFTADSKVIPTITPDYTRTERNTVVSLIIRMFGGEVSETELEHKLSIVGIKYDDVKAYEKFHELVIKHCDVGNVDVVKANKNEEGAKYFTIHDNDSKFAVYARNFSNAYFIIEDDKDKNYYIGAMLYGQVFQKYLPGQMLTYSGKYYQVQTITPESGVVLRRAADHITDRKCYRQRREYALSGFTPDPAMGSEHTSRGVKVRRGFCNKIEVKTYGYYELTSLDNLASAHEVDLNNIPVRSYKNKAVLCLKLSDVGADVRFTMAILLNEIFITLFPESYHFITATVKMPSDTVFNISPLMSPIQLQGFDDEEAIYIIEDCEIDLGLLVSVERNITRLLEIIADYLSWHVAKLAEPALPDDADEEDEAEEKEVEDKSLKESVEDKEAEEEGVKESKVDNVENEDVNEDNDDAEDNDEDENESEKENDVIYNLEDDENEDDESKDENEEEDEDE
ncbi:MAG: S8 family serine peptidase [Treponema sp.]|jgi:subtilisin family serine protease|nr:S8 family serine peptidase [Treponema sp.]